MNRLLADNASRNESRKSSVAKPGTLPYGNSRILVRNNSRVNIQAETDSTNNKHGNFDRRASLQNFGLTLFDKETAETDDSATFIKISVLCGLGCSLHHSSCFLMLT